MKNHLILALVAALALGSFAACSSTDEKDREDEDSSISEKVDDKDEDDDETNNLSDTLKDAVKEYDIEEANANAETVYTAAATYITEYAENSVKTDYDTGEEIIKTSPGEGAVSGYVDEWDSEQTDCISDAVNKYLGTDHKGTYWAVYCNQTSVYGAFWCDEDGNVIGSYPQAIDPVLLAEDFDIPQGGTSGDDYKDAFNKLQKD